MSNEPIFQDKEYTIEEYLALDEASEKKYEYHAGRLVAMTGGTFNHSLLGANIIIAIDKAIRDSERDCLITNSEARIYIEKINNFIYPDASVVCGTPEFFDENQYSLVNPLIIIEVLSKSTAHYDRGAKFRKYRAIPSFKEYIVIDQDQPIIDSFFRDDPTYWRMMTTIGLDQSLHLQSIDCYIPMREIYRNVQGLEEPEIIPE
ncbi:MAG: Uma2 family endonuclease [Bacteroidota bacterium]